MVLGARLREYFHTHLVAADSATPMTSMKTKLVIRTSSSSLNQAKSGAFEAVILDHLDFICEFDMLAGIQEAFSVSDAASRFRSNELPPPAVDVSHAHFQNHPGSALTAADTLRKAHEPPLMSHIPTERIGCMEYRMHMPRERRLSSLPMLGMRCLLFSFLEDDIEDLPPVQAAKPPNPLSREILRLSYNCIALGCLEGEEVEL